MMARIRGRVATWLHRWVLYPIIFCHLPKPADWYRMVDMVLIWVYGGEA